jgi:hypothetical protein
MDTRNASGPRRRADRGFNITTARLSGVSNYYVQRTGQQMNAGRLADGSCNRLDA